MRATRGQCLQPRNTKAPWIAPRGLDGEPEGSCLWEGKKSWPSEWPQTTCWRLLLLLASGFLLGRRFLLCHGLLSLLRCLFLHRHNFLLVRLARASNHLTLPTQQAISTSLSHPPPVTRRIIGSDIPRCQEKNAILEIFFYRQTAGRLEEIRAGKMTLSESSGRHSRPFYRRIHSGRSELSTGHRCSSRRTRVRAPNHTALHISCEVMSLGESFCTGGAPSAAVSRCVTVGQLVCFA